MFRCVNGDPKLSIYGADGASKLVAQDMLRVERPSSLGGGRLFIRPHRTNITEPLYS